MRVKLPYSIATSNRRSTLEISTLLVTDVRAVEVMHKQIAHVGDRVKHLGQRYAGLNGTGTVTGFAISTAQTDIDHPGRPWFKILVKHDNPDEAFAQLPGWDWDRTELIDHAD